MSCELDSLAGGSRGALLPTPDDPHSVGRLPGPIPPGGGRLSRTASFGSEVITGVKIGREVEFEVVLDGQY